MQLKQTISKSSLLFAAVGGIVGSGWLLGPFFSAKVAGPAAIVAWLIGGILMMIVALTFAELASAYPVAGASVRFTQFSHGTFASFTMAWISWLASVMVAPIETLAALQYAANFFPVLIERQSGAIALSNTGLMIAAFVMALMCFINYFGVKYFAKSNSMIVLWKLAVPFITVLILLQAKFSLTNFTAQGFMPMGWHGVLAALPTAGIIFSYIGYSAAIQLAQEAKNPQKTIPFAILGAILIAIILYIAIEIAFIGVLKPADFADGWQNLQYKGDSGPIAGLIAGLGLIWWLKIIYADAIISPIGTAFIYTTATARVNMAMSQNGYFPKWMEHLNSFGTPFKAIASNYFIGLLFFLPFPGWQSMVSFLVSCFVVAYAVGPISCATLRKTQPQIYRPFKLPYYHLFCLMAFYICNLIIYWTGWDVIWKMLVTLAIGYIIFFVHSIKTRKPRDMAAGFWLLPYLIGVGLISYLGNFGEGKNYLSFGWDFLVIALFSLVIYFIAFINGKKFHEKNREEMIFLG